MTSIRGRGRLCKERTSKSLLGSSPPQESSHDKTPANLSAVEPSIAKYIEEDLQKILKTVLKAQVLTSDGAREKPLKGRSLDIYRGKSHMKCYNFYQQCKDHFATAGAKGPNRNLFASSFLHDCINFHCQQYKRKHEAESLVFITWEKFKIFFC